MSAGNRSLKTWEGFGVITVYCCGVIGIRSLSQPRLLYKKKGITTIFSDISVLLKISDKDLLHKPTR